MWLASESFILLSFNLLNSLTASAQKGGRLGFVSIARMSWDEWVNVQMEARPISGRASQASRTLFHGPRVALR
eukprot:scaffold8243_cov129-Isochrysis_galbana.AAC.7